MKIRCLWTFLLMCDWLLLFLFSSHFLWSERSSRPLCLLSQLCCPPLSLLGHPLRLECCLFNVLWSCSLLLLHVNLDIAGRCCSGQSHTLNPLHTLILYLAVYIDGHESRGITQSLANLSALWATVLNLVRTTTHNQFSVLIPSIQTVSECAS